MRHVALALRLSGLSMRATARLVGVAVQTVSRWVRDADLPAPPAEGRLRALQPEELRAVVDRHLAAHGTTRYWLVEPGEEDETDTAGLVWVIAAAAPEPGPHQPAQGRV